MVFDCDGPSRRAEKDNDFRSFPAQGLGSEPRASETRRARPPDHVGRPVRIPARRGGRRRLALALYNLRERVVADEERRLQNLALILSEHTEATLQALELLQTELVDRIQ